MFDSGAMPDSAADFDLQQMMEQLSASDPRMAMLMKMMQASPGEASNDDHGNDERDELITELSEKLDAAEARLDKMTRIARRLYTTHKEDEQRLGNLAAALGACGICWGDDEDCPGCRGRGRIGMVRPDKQMRARLFGQQNKAAVRNECRHEPMGQFS